LVQICSRSHVVDEWPSEVLQVACPENPRELYLWCLCSMSFWQDKSPLIAVITHNCLKFLVVKVGSKGFNDTVPNLTIFSRGN
jgi:hypothetical protein